MHVSFLLRVHADEPALAAAVAAELRRALAGRDAAITLEVASRGRPGVCVAAAVRDADGTPRWLAPVEAPQEPVRAAETVAAWLESWGFIAKRAATPPAA